MNINFEAALRYIDLEDYDKAESELKTAIDTEMKNGSEGTAAEYRCVLGELLADLGKREDARKEFAAVLEYCDRTNTLPMQRRISGAFINAIDKGLPLPDFGGEAQKRRPVFAKPVQDKSFIVKHTNRRGR